MLNILAIIGPLFAAIAIGFAAIRLGFFSKDDVRVLGRFVIQLALPALLFKALAERSLDEIFNLGYLGAYALGSVACLALCTAGARLFLGPLSRPALGMIAVGSSLSNSGFIGFPLVLQFLGHDAAVALALCMLVENLVVLPIALIIAEPAGDGGGGRLRVLLGLLRGLLRNPLILAILGGFACSLLQLRLPLPVARVVDLFAGASGPVALFVIGGTLVGLRPGGDLPRILWVSAGKLILHPLAVALALWAFLPGDPLLQAAGVIIAALPMFSIFPIIAQKYDEQSWCASTLLVATLGSFVTLSVVLWLVGASLRG
ncbi:AEC family transporter [Castellaniella defragrans]|uniref:Auxin Efflux Carrier n=2 Tax=Castellaniella defragrans TaxID=75697 RepID=W8WTK0_CASD6|nr:AEC family transporter [Castellaniella defragrans]KAB0622633.1 AEC family transporter [Castellaniella defragrans]MBB6082043.1 hypothetical protein [Castellaniella defragrans]CDM23018.1 Auxin Efflux Carrier [Castellaniella defragrans 65Phen]